MPFSLNVAHLLHHSGAFLDEFHQTLVKRVNLLPACLQTLLGARLRICSKQWHKSKENCDRFHFGFRRETLNWFIHSGSTSQPPQSTESISESGCSCRAGNPPASAVRDIWTACAPRPSASSSCSDL